MTIMVDPPFPMEARPPFFRLRVLLNPHRPNIVNNLPRLLLRNMPGNKSEHRSVRNAVSDRPEKLTIGAESLKLNIGEVARGRTQHRPGLSIAMTAHSMADVTVPLSLIKGFSVRDRLPGARNRVLNFSCVRGSSRTG